MIKARTKQTDTRPIAVRMCRRARRVAFVGCLLIPGCGRSGGGGSPNLPRMELDELSEDAQARQREELEKITIHLGGGIALGNLRIAPKKVELRKVSATDRSGRKTETKEPVLVLTFQVQNVAMDEKQVFEPLAQATGKDNIGHDLKRLGGRFRGCRLAGDQQHDELKPGDRATILVCLKPASKKAAKYRWLIHTKVRNAPVDDWEKWCLEFDADEIETP